MMYTSAAPVQERLKTAYWLTEATQVGISWEALPFPVLSPISQAGDVSMNFSCLDQLHCYHCIQLKVKLVI